MKIIVLIFIFSVSCFASSNIETVNNSIDLILISSHLNSQTVKKRQSEILEQAKKFGLEQNNKVKYKLQVLANYASIKESFEDCAKNNANQEKYYDRILTQVRQAAFTECIPSKSLDNGVSENFVSDMQTITTHLQMKEMNEQLIDESLQSSVTGLLSFRKKFEGQDTSYNSIETTICKKVRCDTSTKEKIKSMYDKALSKTKDIIPAKLSHVVSSLNSQLMKINEKAKKVSAPVKEGYFTNSARTENRRTQERYEEYKREFTKILVNNEYNNLMFTEQFKDKVGTLKTLDDLEKDGPGRYVLSEHETINHNDVNAAYSQAESKITDQIELLFNEDLSGNRTTSDYVETSAKFVKHYPASVGKVLIKDPIKAKSICSVVSYVDQEAKSDEKWDKAFKVGGMAIGIGLMATGIGAGVGSVILTGAAASTSVTIATATVVGSVALGATEAAYHTKQAIEAYNENKAIEQSILSGTGDEQSYEEARLAFSRMEDAQIDAAMSLGFSAVDMGSVKTAIMTSRFGKNLMNSSMRASDKAKYLDDITSNYQAIAKDKELMEYFGKNLGILGPDNKEQMADFLAVLSRVEDDNLRNSLMLKLKDSKPEDFKKLVERTVHEARSC